MSSPRLTIAVPVEVSGRGVHSGASGTLRLCPGPAGSGIVFYRTDLAGSQPIPATHASIRQEQMARQTTLAQGEAHVETVEHVLSAAVGLGLTDLGIELDCPEVPFLDGSAAPFVDLIDKAGIAPCPNSQPVEPITIPRPLVFSDSSSEICAFPSEDFRVTFFFTSTHPGLRTQSISLVVTPDSYRTQIAAARTFCFFEEIEQMRRMNLIKGASLASAVVIGRKAVLNESLRFPDEPVRHKVLDLIGDLALLGAPLKGHIMAWRAGHRVNATFGLYLRKELGL